MTHTDADEASGGKAGVGGAFNEGQGGASTSGGATSLSAGGVAGAIGARGGSGGCGPNTVAPELHATCIEDLGNGRLRFHYDFGDTTQSQDWVTSTGATVNVRQGALVVTSASDNIGVAIFRKKLQTDRLSFKVSLLSGNTTNWYINTVWSGSWDPPAGYGGYHDYSGRGFIINGTKHAPGDVSPLSIGVMQQVVVEQSITQLTWTQQDVAMSEAIGPLPVTDRVLALGAWQSSAAFFDVVFEGTLD